MPELPTPRGPLSAAVMDALRTGSAGFPPVAGADPELRNRGCDDVPDDREWDPALLTVRAAMERLFLDALRRDTEPGADVAPSWTRCSSNRSRRAACRTTSTAPGRCGRCGAHLDVAPAVTLAEVNLMSLCGLHRSLRGALVGQFAAVELTSSPGSDRLVRAMTRLGLPADAVEFYAEHVEADAVHEQVVRRGVITPLLEAEPDLAADIVFGIRAAGFLADRFADHVLSCWARDESSLVTITRTPRLVTT